MSGPNLIPKRNRAVALRVKAGGATTRTLGLPGKSGPTWYPRLRNTLWLILVTLVLAGGQPSRAADSDSPTPRQGNGGRVPIIDTSEAQGSSLERDFTNQVILGGRQIEAADSSTGSSGMIWVLVSLTLAGIFGWHKYVAAGGEFFNRSNVPKPAAPLAPADIAAEEEAFSRFVAAFSIHAQRPGAPPPDKANDSGSLRQAPAPKPDSTPVTVQREPDPLDVCLAGAARDLAGIRTSFSEISRAPDEIGGQAALSGLLLQVRCLKVRAELPAMLPVWQLATALEGLVDQIAKHPGKKTPSAVRTIAGAVDLLHALCVRGLKPNLLSDPPVRLLAVDDDPVSRHVVAFALNRVFAKPDLAIDGAAALVLVQQQSYDVIFLDVQMPGMDGFELCFRIHGTALNQTTPVVFVTTQGDLGSRAKSSLTGGQDLLAKPILTWELALKALTLIMRRRLEALRCGEEVRPGQNPGLSRPAPDQPQASASPLPDTPRRQPDALAPAPL